MKIKDKDLPYFYEIADLIINHPIFLKSKKYPHHSNYSCYDHSVNVAKRCYAFVKKWHIPCNLEALIRSALFHDFYLYDWHDKNKGFRFHGFVHPTKAILNSKLICELTNKEKRAIRSHMWPLTLFHIPTSIEGWVLTYNDKIQAIKEAFTKKKA